MWKVEPFRIKNADRKQIIGDYNLGIQFSIGMACDPYT